MSAGEQPAGKVLSKYSFRALFTHQDTIKRRRTKIAEDFIQGSSGPFDQHGIPPFSSVEVVERPEDSPGTKKQGVIPQTETAPSGPPPDLTTTKVEAEDAEALFKDAVRKYESEAKRKYKTNVDPDQLHTVEQLLRVVNEAAETHRGKEDERGLWGLIRRAFHKLGEARDTINGWLGLLPSESEYMSVVCGGLMLIVQVAARVKDISDAILQGLQQIPTILNTARRVLRLFKDSEALRERSTALYLTILTAMGRILEDLRPKTTRKKILQAGVAIFEQQGFKTDLTDSIDAIATERDFFNDEAEACHKEASHALQQAFGRHQQATDEQHQMLKRLMEEANEERERSLRSLRAIEKFNKHLDEQIILMRKENSETNKLLIKLLKSNPRLDQVAEGECTKLYREDEEEPEQVISRSNTVASIFTGRRRPLEPPKHRARLLSRLKFDLSIVDADLRSTFTAGPRLDSQDQDRVVYAIRAPKLAAFIRVSRSAILFMNGRAPATSRCSALSFVVARFVVALRELVNISSSPVSSDERPPIIALHFFCGQHHPGTDWASPAGMVNNLLAQLAYHCRSDDLASVSALRSFDNGNVQEVFARFKTALATSVPTEATVFCVIDAMMTYVADGETAEDAEWLIGALANLVKLARKKSRKFPVFKVLLTAPNRFNIPDITEALSEGEILNLPEGPALVRTGGFSALKWDLSIGQQISGLSK